MARIIGADENGLGPRLGPLVVTGVELRADRPLAAMAVVCAATGIDDSKNVFSSRTRARGEAIALGILAAAGTDRRGAVIRGPFERPSVCPFDAESVALGACPAIASAMPTPRWSGAPRDAATPLASLGLSVERVASVVVCPGQLNALLAGGTSKLSVDLRLFEHVVNALARGASGPVRAVCGKVGGTDRYAERFSLWPRQRVIPVEESRASSRYAVKGLGEIAFVRDADAAEPAVAMASIVGKYLRERWMDDLATAFGWEGPMPSGYHDALTTQFIQHTRARLERGLPRLPPDCLERIR